MLLKLWGDSLCQTLFISSGDFILALICYILVLLSYLWDVFNIFCFMCFYKYFSSGCKAKFPSRKSKAEEEVGGSRQIGIRKTRGKRTERKDNDKSNWKMRSDVPQPTLT